MTRYPPPKKKRHKGVTFQGRRKHVKPPEPPPPEDAEQLRRDLEYEAAREKRLKLQARLRRKQK